MTGRGAVNQAFADQGLAPTFVLSAMDSDVIKTYVELGIGIGLLAEMAFDPKQDTKLGAISAKHLFTESVTKIALKRNAFLRAYTYALIELLAPALTQQAVDSAMLA
jgi:LysR family cys regulon transcriptional activator